MLEGVVDLAHGSFLGRATSIDVREVAGSCGGALVLLDERLGVKAISFAPRSASFAAESLHDRADRSYSPSNAARAMLSSG
jgi:hypothetical protein